MTSARVSDVRELAADEVPSDGAAPWPRQPDDLTSTWLTELLGATVESFELKPLMNGMAAQAAVVVLTYVPAPTEPRPQSIVIKFAHATPQGRARCAPMYEKELRFYRELAPEVAPLMPVPAVLAAHGDTGAATPTEFFCLVLEDLSVEFELLHASRGTGEREAAALLRQVARVQAKFWEGGAARELDWLASRREELTGSG